MWNGYNDCKVGWIVIGPSQKSGHLGRNRHLSHDIVQSPAALRGHPVCHRVPGANAAVIGMAFGAMEALVRCLATDLGPSGVRVVGIRPRAMLETRTIQQ